jgi:hypothetical protein
MADCPLPSVLIEERIDRVLTQYRESPNLLFLLRTYLEKIEEVLFALCGIPELFHVDTAVGDQLTLIGKRLGFPRCHCVCNVQPVFGFECEGVTSAFPIVGFCEDGTWSYCGSFGVGEICIEDDDLYRRFLKVRIYQYLALYDLVSLTEAIRIMWGDQAVILDADHGRVVIAPGRDLTSSEDALMQIVGRVMPIAPGIRQRYHFGTDVHVFGFGEGWGGFCEEWFPDGAPEGTSGGDIIETDDEDVIITAPMTRGATWMCQTDVHPYDCIGI